MKEKHYTVISTDVEKSCDKIQHPFMIKTFNKLGIEGNHLNIIKVTYEKFTAYIIPKMKDRKPFLLE